MRLLFFPGNKGMLLYSVIPQVGIGFLYVLLKISFLFKIDATYVVATQN